MKRFNAFLLFAAAVFAQSHAPAAAGDFVFTLRGFSREYHIEDWRMPDDPLLVRAVMLVGKRVEDYVAVEYLPLFAARNAAVAREMLAAGMPVDIRGPGRETALFHVRDVETARVLLAAGADVNAKDENDDTALRRAADGDITELLLARGAMVPPDDDGYDNILETAPDAKAVRLLVAAGANAKAQTQFSSPLMTAGNAGVVRELLKAGADARYKDDKGKTPLHVAPDAESARLLLAAGADVNARDNDGRTPLMHANDPACVKLLIAAGANGADVVDEWQCENPLFYVTTVDDAATDLAKLRADGQDIKKLLNARNEEGNTPLMHALVEHEPGFFAYQTFKDAIPELDLQDWKYSLTLKHEGVQSVLREMQSQDMLELVRAFVAAGADVNLANEQGRTPLFYARKPETVRVLLEAGARVNGADKQKRTPLHEMIRNNASSQAVGVMIEVGADVNARDKLGWSPLMTLAACSDSLNSDIPAITRLLADAGADVNMRPYDEGDEEYDWMEYTGGSSGKQEPNWFRAIDRMHDWEAVQVLLDAGADIERENGEMTPLHFRGDCPLVVRTLIDAGADVNARDEEGRTPLFYAYNSRSVRLLVAAGADVNARDDEGRTPLFEHVSVQWADYDVVKTLIALGADANVRDDYGESVLSQAHEDDWETREALIAAGAVEEDDEEE